MERPLHKRIFVFCVRERQRLVGNSGLYVPDSRRGMLTRAEDVFVLTPADDCIHSWTRGQHLLIADGFELCAEEFDFWEKYQDDPAFKEVKEYAEKCEGKVHTSLISEGSVLAEVTGDLWQSEPMW